MDASLTTQGQISVESAIEVCKALEIVWVTYLGFTIIGLLVILAIELYIRKNKGGSNV